MSYKFNPFTGMFDYFESSSSSSVDNFSYKTIASGVTVTIPQYQQMIVFGGKVIITGVLKIDGDLAVLD